MENQKISFEIILLFFVALLGGITSTIIYRLNLSMDVLIIIAATNFVAVVGLIVGWEFYYQRRIRRKSFSDKKETRNNTREILSRMKDKK